MARKLLWPFGSAVMLVAFAIAFSLALPSAGALQNDPNATPTEGDDSTTDNNFNTSNDNSGTTSDGNGNSNSDDNTDTTNNDSNTNNDSIDNSNPDDNTDTSNDDSGTGNDGNVSPDNDTDTSTDSATPPVTPTDTIDIEIPVTETGSLNLSIIYLDQPLSNQGASCSLTAVLTNVDGDVEASGGFDSCGDHHVFRDVPVGDYQLRLLYDGHLILPEVSITINADQSTSHTFDISEVVGIVVGIVTINGQPLTNGQYLVCGMTTGQTCQMPNPDGHFRLLLPTGTGTGLINDGSNSQLDTFDFTVTAGQATEIGTFDIKTEVEVTGSLDVSFSYLGQPLSEHGAACQISAVLTTVDGNFVTRGGFDGCDGNGPLHFTNWSLALF